MRHLFFFCTLVLGSTAAHALADWNTAVSASNPLNWYRLDEAAGPTAFDYGSEGLNGIYGVGANAPVLRAAGLVGGAASFDGSQRNLLLNGSELSGDWTAEFIVKKTGTKFSAELLRGAPLDSFSSHLKLEQYPDTGLVGYTQSFITDQVFSPPYAAPIGDFVHLVYVKTATQMQLYANGLLVGSNPSTIALSRYQFGDTDTESPVAVVDEILVYGRALSAIEVATHFNAIPEPGTLALAALGAFGLLITACRKR